MARTSSSAVRAILLDHYDGSSDLAAFIRPATKMTNFVASKDEDGVLDDETLSEIEAFLAAHFYAHADQLKSEEHRGRSGAVYQGRTEMGLRSTQYGQAAIDLDFTGTLAGLGKKKLKGYWLGTEDTSGTHGY